MRKENIVTAIVLLLAAAYIVMQSIGMEYKDAEGVPGPGFIPFWSGALIGFLSLLTLYQNVGRAAVKDTQKAIFNKEFFQNVGKLLGASVVAMSLVNFLGMLTCIGLLTGYLSRVLGLKKIKVNIIMAVLTPVIFWLVFSLGLEMRFPEGPLGF